MTKDGTDPPAFRKDDTSLNRATAGWMERINAVFQRGCQGCCQAMDESAEPTERGHTFSYRFWEGVTLLQKLFPDDPRALAKDYQALCVVMIGAWVKAVFTRQLDTEIQAFLIRLSGATLFEGSSGQASPPAVGHGLHRT
jgi:hypothetical protein